MIHLLINKLEKQFTQALDTAVLKTAALKTECSDFNFISLQIALDDSFPIVSIDNMEHFFLNKSDDNHCLLGLGELISISASGSKRFETLKSRFQELLMHWYNYQSSPPLAFIAFAFDEQDNMSGDWQNLPNALLQIPRILITKTSTGKTLQINLALPTGDTSNTFKSIHDLLAKYLSSQTVIVAHSKNTSAEARPVSENSDDLAHSDKLQWQNLSRLALEQIHKGSFDKLVTSRQQWVTLEHPVSLSSLTDKLIKHYPACTILSFLNKGKKLVSASPEQLISLHDSILKSEAIGGTLLRSPVEEHNPPRLLPTDQENPEYLKLLKEHSFIAQDIYQRLDPLCHSLKMPCSPYLMKLHNMYHLETPLEGILQEQFDIFDLIKALHPTPAIAGFPALQAREWLLDHEGYQRGWYSGAFGWIDASMNGELSVMLRCALLQDNQAHLYAGAGLISESDPDIEWQETELKMQTILELLGDTVR